MVMRADVSRPREVEAMIARAVAAFGRLDILYNDATMVEAGQIAHVALEKRPARFVGH